VLCLGAGRGVPPAMGWPEGLWDAVPDIRG
jgi:hypothetical protein